MAPYKHYNIDLTPQHMDNYWQVEIDAWLIKKGDPEAIGALRESFVRNRNLIGAKFLLTLTSAQLTEIRRGRNIDQTWDRLGAIFEYCGPAKEAPLFRQVAHQDLDGTPETRELLRKFLKEIRAEEDMLPLSPSPLTVLRKLVTDPDVFESRKTAVSRLGPVGMLYGVKRICGCNPYVPTDEIPENERSLINCTYCNYDILILPNIEEGEVLVYDPGADSLRNVLKSHLNTEIISIAKIAATGNRIIFKRDEAIIASGTGEVIFRAVRPQAIPDKIVLDGVTTQPPGRASLATWHRRLGHIDLRDLLSCPNQSAYVDLKLSTQSTDDSPSCEICKAVKLPGLPRRQVRKPGTNNILQIIYADYCGPIPGRSEDTVLHFVCFTDDASGWMTIYIVDDSEDILKYFKQYVNQVEVKFRSRIHTLQSNDDLGKAFDGYLRARGIKRRNKPTDTQHIHALLETAKCLLAQSRLDDTLYIEALVTACYIRNRSSAARLDGLTPFQIWFGTPPSVKHMHEFGAPVTCRTICRIRGELETKEGRYLGFDKKNKAYRIWIPDYGEVALSSDVDFDEKVNPQEESGTWAGRRRSNASGTIERPGTSNSEAGTSGRQTTEIILKLRQILRECSRSDRIRIDHSGPPQRNDRDCNDHMSSGGYHIPGSREEDSNADGHEKGIISEEKESGASGKAEDNNDVGEPTVTSEPVEDSPEEQTPARTSAQSSAQPSARPSTEGEGPGAVPGNTHHEHVPERITPSPTPAEPTQSGEC